MNMKFNSTPIKEDIKVKIIRKKRLSSCSILISWIVHLLCGSFIVWWWGFRSWVLLGLVGRTSSAGNWATGQSFYQHRSPVRESETLWISNPFGFGTVCVNTMKDHRQGACVKQCVTPVAYTHWLKAVSYSMFEAPVFGLQPTVWGQVCNFPLLVSCWGSKCLGVWSTWGFWIRDAQSVYCPQWILPDASLITVAVAEIWKVLWGKLQRQDLDLEL